MKQTKTVFQNLKTLIFLILFYLISDFSQF